MRTVSSRQRRSRTHVKPAISFASLLNLVGVRAEGLLELDLDPAQDRVALGCGDDEVIDDAGDFDRAALRASLGADDHGVERRHALRVACPTPRARL